MGNKVSEGVEQLYSMQSQWNPTNIPLVYQHVSNQQFAEVCSVVQQTTNQIQIYDFRHKNNRYLVDVLGIIVNEAENMCTRSSIQNIFIQYIPYRLPDLGALAYQDAIYVLYQCIRGLKILQQKFQLFPIDEEMIGFNHLGTCKIWINFHYYSNKNQNCKLNVQREAVEHLLKIIEPRMTFLNSEQHQYQSVKSRYLLKNLQSAFTFLNELRSLNKVKDDYHIDLPPLMLKRQDKLSLKKSLRKKIQKKGQTNPQIMYETPTKKTFLSSMTTQRESKTLLTPQSRTRHKSQIRWLELKKNIKQAKNIL